jgi:hypothetical protein
VRFALRRSKVFVPIGGSTSTYSTMSFKSSLLIPLINLTGVLAIPTQHRLEDIQCRCLSFSPSSQPMLCNYLEPHVLDWQTASKLASESDLKIHFSSELTVTQVLSIPSPLPSSTLQSLSEEVGEPFLMRTRSSAGSVTGRSRSAIKIRARNRLCIMWAFCLVYLCCSSCSTLSESISGQGELPGIVSRETTTNSYAEIPSRMGASALEETRRLWPLSSWPLRIL